MAYRRYVLLLWCKPIQSLGALTLTGFLLQIIFVCSFFFCSLFVSFFIAGGPDKHFVTLRLHIDRAMGEAASTNIAVVVSARLHAVNLLDSVGVRACFFFSLIKLPTTDHKFDRKRLSERCGRYWFVRILPKISATSPIYLHTHIYNSAAHRHKHL